MTEQQADLWSTDADWVVVTTNLVVNRANEAVMGKGCALEAAQRHPHLARRYGEHILARGGEPYLYENHLVCLPTKVHWRQPAQLPLIEVGLRWLHALWEEHSRAAGRPLTVVLPRLGCGAGYLSWETVRPVVARLLPEDCWVVVHPKQ